MYSHLSQQQTKGVLERSLVFQTLLTIIANHVLTLKVYFANNIVDLVIEIVIEFTVFALSVHQLSCNLISEIELILLLIFT